jgi:hypothetical protein
MSFNIPNCGRVESTSAKEVKILNSNTFVLFARASPLDKDIAISY